MVKRPEPGMPCVFTIGGRDLRLRFPLRVLKELEADHNISILRGLRGFGANTDAFILLLAYGLKTDQPDITRDWVEDNFDATMMIDLGRLIAYAATGVWTETESPNGAGVGPVNHTTGSPSGPLDDTTSDLVSTNSGT